MNDAILAAIVVFFAAVIIIGGWVQMDLCDRAGGQEKVVEWTGKSGRSACLRDGQEVYFYTK